MRSRMFECYAAGMKMKPLRSFRGGSALSAVEHVSDYRSAKAEVVGGVDAELVSAACSRFKLDVNRAVIVPSCYIVEG